MLLALSKSPRSLTKTSRFCLVTAAVISCSWLVVDGHQTKAAPHSPASTTTPTPTNHQRKSGGDGATGKSRAVSREANARGLTLSRVAGSWLLVWPLVSGAGVAVGAVEGGIVEESPFVKLHYLH